MYEPAGAFDVLHKLGDKFVAEVRAEVARVELHVALQGYVEEHHEDVSGEIKLGF